jgi:zinc protease
MMFMKNFLVLVACFGIFIAHAQEVVELKQPQADKIVVKVMFTNGSVCDPPGKEGLTNLTAELMAQGGTKSYTSSEIKDIAYPMAAEYSVSTDKEVSIFTFSFHTDHLEKFYEIIKEIMLTPAFSDDDFSRIRSNHLNYVEQVIKASSDEDYSKMMLEDMLFRGTNYQHMVSGTITGLNSITVDDVKSHYRNYFTRNNYTAGVAGNYPDGFVTKLKNDLNTLSEFKTVLPVAGAARTANGVEVELITKNNALGSAIYTGTPLSINRSHNDFAALMVANSYFGEHRKSYSLLYKKIREQRSMNYGAYSYIEWYQSGGWNMLPPAGVPRSVNYFSMWIRPVQTAASLKSQYPELADIEVGHAHFALRMAVRELDKMISNGLSKEDFELTREFLKSYIKLYAQTTERQLGYLLDSRFYGRKDYLKEMDALLSQLTVEDVNRAIKKYLQKDNMFVSIITHVSEAEPLMQSLLENKTSEPAYSNELKAVLTDDILSEDEKVAVYPLKVTSVKIIKSEETFHAVQ